MALDGCNCWLSFRAIFCLFTPLAAIKMKISKQWKKHLEMSSFYTSVLEIWHVTHVIVVFHFGQVFSFLQSKTISPKQPKNIKFQKKWEKHLEMSSFYTCVQKIMIRWCTVSEIWLATDGQTEKVTYRRGCPTLKLHNIGISSHDLLQNFIKPILLEIRPKTFSERGYRHRNFLPSTLTFLRTSKNAFPRIW